MRIFVFLSTCLVTPCMLVLLPLAGILLLFCTRGRPFLLVFSCLFGRKCHKKQGDVSPFRALTVALAGTLGVGNIVGVATAIHLGGAGALFWMWVSAILAAVLKYSETVLAVAYGGSPMSYMGRRVGNVFAGICLAASLVLGNGLQARAVTDTCATVWAIPPAVSASLLAGVVLLITVGGVKRISEVTVRLIPALTLVFCLLCFGLIWQFRSGLPDVFSRIFREAFSLRSAGGGVGGYAILRAMRLGTMRGLFSNEAGCGTAPMAHATAKHATPAAQGLWGVLEVCIDTLLLCTLSGVAFLLFPDLCARYDGMELAIRAFRMGYGRLSDVLLSVSVLLFALASILTWSYYGTTALAHFTKKSGAVTAYHLLYGGFCALSFLAPAATLWAFTDLSIGIMTILNTCSVLALRSVVARETAIFCGST